MNLETLRVIFPYSLLAAAVGLIESLLTLTLVDEITETRGHGNRECLGQGAANLLCGFLGAMGGCAMIGQSMINIKSNQKGSRVYHLRGQLFFGSARNFADLFNPADDPDDVIIDFHYSRVHDHSGIEAINALAERYSRLGKTLHLIDLSPECAQLLDSAGDMVDVKVYEDLKNWHIATDKLG
jgi:MFS superfamily sulfate permease-like transporter